MSQPNFQKPRTASKTEPASDWLKPVGTCFGLLLLLGGLNLLWSGLDGIPGDKSHRDFITGVVLLGGALGLIGVAWGLFDPTPPKTAMKPGLFYGIGAALAVFIGFFILHYGMHQIGGFDHGSLVDTGWRLFSGQKAYVDFPCTTPVAYALGLKFSLQWFGDYWRSIIDIIALFAVPTFVWSLFLLAQLFGRSWTTLLWALTVQAFSPMLVAYWEYNPITAVSAVIYMLSATYWLRRPAEKSAVMCYGAALFLMATMKVNVAGILIPGISVVLFISPKHRWKVIWISLGAFVLFLLLMAINDLSFTGMITGYLSVAHRGASLVPFLLDLNPFEQRMAMLMIATFVLPAILALSLPREAPNPLSSWIPAVALLVGLFIFISHQQKEPLAFMAYDENKPVGVATLFLTVAVALVMGRRRLFSRGPWIPVIGLLAGIYGFVSNSEQKLVDLPPVMCATLLLAAELRSSVFPEEGPVFQMPVWWNRYFALVCMVLGAAALAQGMARDRIQVIGPFFEYDGAKHTLTNGFFNGVQCGDLFDEVLKEEAEVMRREPSSTIWFGPRMQWGYAAFHKPSPLHQPVIWDSGQTMYAKSKEDYYFNNFLQSRPQLCILFKNDVTFLSKDEVQRMVQQYNVDQSFPVLTVLHLKP